MIASLNGMRASSPPSSPLSGFLVIEAVRAGLASIRSNPLRASLAAVAVAAAVATLVFVSTALGAIATLARTSAARAFGSESFLIAKVAQVGNISRKELELKLQRNPSITRSDSRFLDRHAGDAVIYGPMAQRDADTTAGPRKYEGASVIGSTANIAVIRDLALERGRFFREDEATRAAQVAVIGPEIASALFPDLDPIGQTLRLGGRGFEVIGLQEKSGTVGGMNVDRYIYIPLAAYERVFGAPETLSIFAKAPRNAEIPEVTAAAEDRARATMRARRRLAPGAEDTFDILTPEAVRGFIVQILQRIGLAAGPIALMALLAAIIVVTNTILVSVTQRTREIGVRRAVGATRGRILSEVLAESSLLALVGGVVGLSGVWVLLKLIGKYGQLEFIVSPGVAVFAVVAATLSGLVAGLYPAVRATRIDVIAALRSE